MNVGAGRGLYWASSDELFAVVGPNVYFVDETWTFNLLGNIPNGTTPVYMVDDDTQVLLVDGSQYGYSINLATHAFARVTDANFLGADRCDFLDTFLLTNVPGTQEFQSTLPNVFQWDPLYFASKTAYNDKLAALIVMHREIWLLGELTTEIWYNAGNAAFPFAILPGTFVEHGCAAKYSVCKHDLRIFWLSRDKDGVAMALMGANYRAERISTHAMEVAWSKYPTTADAVAYTYQQQGHIFWVINFPSGDATWVYDLQTGLWHERSWTDPSDGTEHRHRVQCASIAYFGYNVGLDWQNGTLYKIDLDNYTDDFGPIVRRRGFPHQLTNGSRVSYACFRADMEAGAPPMPSMIGNGLLTGIGGAQIAQQTEAQAATVYLRWSDDRGKSFSNPVGMSFGMTGEYNKQPQWRRLGLARDRVFELYWSGPKPTALNGAYVDAMPMAS